MRYTKYSATQFLADHSAKVTKMASSRSLHVAQRTFIVLTLGTLISAIPPDLTITTNYGQLKGMDLDQSYGFWGIPFAQPPVGDGRLREPLPPLSWSDVRNATEHSDGCMQLCHEPPPACPLTWSEDCLYLDIWVPKSGRTDYPVFLFMHGGAFRDGSGGALLYDSRLIAQEMDAIIITINYRMEAFGFVFLGDVYDPATGNVENIVNLGLKDQQMAFKWTKENIAYFDGDPNRVTIGGQSAGAQSTGVHLLMESSKDLFDQAIMLSNPYSLPYKTIDDGLQLATAVASNIGCENVLDLDCWRAATAQELLDASRTATNGNFNPNELLQLFEPWGPGVGEFTEIPEEVTEAYQKGQAQRKPTIFGSVREEGRLYIFLLFQQTLPTLRYRLFLRALMPAIFPQLMDLYPADRTQGADQREILSDLATDYIFHCSALNATLGMAEHGHLDYYHYVFDDAFSFEEQWTDDFKMCWGHVCHGGDLAYVFRTPTLGGVAFTEEEEILADHMSAYISNFLHTGNPNVPGTEALKAKHAQLEGRRPHWPRMTEKPNNYYTMYYSTCGGNTVLTNYREHYCQLFDEFGYYKVPRLNSIDEELFYAEDPFDGYGNEL